MNVSCDGGVSEELNSFLRRHRVLGVDKRFIEHGEQSYWCFCVEFLDGDISGKKAGNGVSSKKGVSRVDYKEILSEKEFAGFLRLRPAAPGWPAQSSRSILLQDSCLISGAGCSG